MIYKSMKRYIPSDFVNSLQIENDYQFQSLNNIILSFYIVNSNLDCKSNRNRLYFIENDNQYTLKTEE